MARGNFDQIDGAGLGTKTNKFASIKRAPLVPRGPRIRRNADPDAVIESEYELYKDEVLRSLRGKLASKKIKYADLDLDGFYNQAWHSVYMKLADGEDVDNRRGLLVTIAYRRAVDDFRALHPERRADVESLDTIGVENDVESLMDERAQLHQFMLSLRGELTERELQAAGLCYVYGYTRPEAAEVLGVRPQRMEKIMDSVSKKITPVVGNIKSGEWCETNSSLISAYALGLLDNDTERYSMAVEHLKECSACRHDVLRKRGIASMVAPLPFLVLAGKAAAAVGVGGAAAGAAAGGHSAASGGAGSGFSLASIAGAAGVVGAVGVMTIAVAASKPLAESSKSKPIATTAPPYEIAQIHSRNKADVLPKAVHKAPKPKRKKRKAAKKSTPAAEPVQVQQPQQQQETTPAPAPVQQTPAPAPQQQSPSSTDDGAGEFDLK